MSNYTLTYKKGKSQEIYIEEIGNGNNESLYFNQEYKEARKLIKEIVDLQGTKDDKDKKDKIKKYGCNNRILFTGQRGCGKTSVMHSLADYLSKLNPKPTLVNKDGNEFPTDVMFCCLPIVDPSHFDNNNNILLTVITSMFSEAKRKMNKSEDGGDTSYREELLKQFEKVFKSLDSIKSQLSSYTLESLNRKSDAEDLRDKMNILVSKFLKYVVGNNEARLILLIDDIDMSVSYAPEMLEQLRKYLELDNLIILMSANLGQLNNEMREKYSSAFQYTLKDSNQALSIDVEDLATKYLLKLFPTSRRINVERHVNQLLNTDLIVEGWNKKADKEKDFQKVLLSLIWSKTRLLFIPKDPKNTLHPIIPTNLRDLAQFLDMLTALPTVSCEGDNLFGGKKAYTDCLDNLQFFRNYFMKTWIPNHLNVQEELVFHNIPTDITEINKHLINSINIIGTKHKNDLMSREVGLDIIERNADNVFIDRDIYTMVSPNDPKFVKANKISDIFNQPSNYSYGDLLLMIDKYETYFESEEHRKFTNAIKIYYSILLFETMFFKSGDVVYDVYDRIVQSLDENEKRLFEPERDLKTYVKSVYEKENPSNDEKKIILMLQEKISNIIPIIPIQKLIGGNVYYPNYFEIITDKNFNQKGPSYDAKRAFYHKIEVDGDGKNVENKCPVFAVLYYGDIRPDRYDKNHIYDTKFQANAEVDTAHYVTFDILSVLNNMLNPCQTISRLDSSEARKMQANWFDKIQEWGDTNKIKGTQTHTPNAILPFYSVDIMLQYLSQSYAASTVIGKKNEYVKEKNLMDNGCKILFHLSGDLGKEQLEKLSLLKIDEPKYTSLLKELIVDKENKKQGVSEELTDNDIKNIFVQLPEKVIKLDWSEQLKTNISILKKLRKKYRGLNSTESNTVFFRDYVISLLLEQYTGSKKDRDGLIKELRKYTTISEVYKHLVEALWENAIMELLIRADIQEKERTPESVGKYYELLWEETEKMLNYITTDPQKSKAIYQNLCKEAGKKFICNKFLDN